MKKKTTKRKVAKKKEIEKEKEFETITYEPEDIVKMKRDVEFFSADRKKMTVSELKDEMDTRSVGYMTNWSKSVLIKRLEEEDERDAILITVLQDKKHFLDTKEEKVLEAQRRTKLLNKELNDVAVEIDEHQKKINDLCEKRQSLNIELEEAKVSLKLLDL